jgi:hypothetical protein
MGLLSWCQSVYTPFPWIPHPSPVCLIRNGLAITSLVVPLVPSQSWDYLWIPETNMVIDFDLHGMSRYCPEQIQQGNTSQHALHPEIKSINTQYHLLKNHTSCITPSSASVTVNVPLWTTPTKCNGIYNRTTCIILSPRILSAPPGRCTTAAISEGMSGAKNSLQAAIRNNVSCNKFFIPDTLMAVSVGMLSAVLHKGIVDCLCNDIPCAWTYNGTRNLHL